MRDWKATVRSILDGDHPRFGRPVLFLIYAFIIVSVLSIGFETLPDLPPWARAALTIEEIVVVAFFTMEYLLRIASAERPLRYVGSLFGIVDLLAILPFYLSLGLDLRSLRTLRLLRVFRLLKLTRYNDAADRFAEAWRATREELVVFFAAAIIVLYLCSIGIYYFEHDAQPEAFSSVFDSMWWAAVTLTTVGYGDVYPITTGGRIFTVVVLFVGLGAIAVPTGIVGAALARMRRPGDPEA